MMNVTITSSSVGKSFQVIPVHGNPHMRRTLFDGYLFKYCSIKYQIFYQASEKTSQQTYCAPKNHLKSFSDASKSHKTSTNVSDRAYFRQFSDWQEKHFGHSQESPCWTGDRSIGGWRLSYAFLTSRDHPLVKFYRVPSKRGYLSSVQNRKFIGCKVMTIYELSNRLPPPYKAKDKT